MLPPIVELSNRTAWRDWLAANHRSSGTIWLVISKKGQTGVSYTDAVEEALCYGWIDSRANKLDATRFLLLVSPRKRGSIWSKVNKERVARLETLGLLAAPGLAKIQAAKADGSWFALDEVEALHVPPALAEALAANPDASSRWDACRVSLRKQVLYWLASARQKDTIARRIERIINFAEADRLSELFTSARPEVQVDS
jgi:uncharacterized protein YdeI (YjbR/CyaY-like superfamily)